MLSCNSTGILNLCSGKRFKWMTCSRSARRMNGTFDTAHPRKLREVGSKEGWCCRETTPGSDVRRASRTFERHTQESAEMPSLFLKKMVSFAQSISTG